MPPTRGPRLAPQDACSSPSPTTTGAHPGDNPGAPGSGDRETAPLDPTGHLLHKATPSRPGHVAEIPNTKKQHRETGKMRTNNVDLKSGQGTQIDIFPKKTYRWPTDI